MRCTLVTSCLLLRVIASSERVIVLIFMVRAAWVQRVEPKRRSTKRWQRGLQVEIVWVQCRFVYLLSLLLGNSEWLPCSESWLPAVP